VLGQLFAFGGLAFRKLGFQEQLVGIDLVPSPESTLG